MQRAHVTASMALHAPLFLLLILNIYHTLHVGSSAFSTHLSLSIPVNLQCLHMKQNVSLVAAPGNIHRCNMSPPKERLMSLTVKVFFSNTMNQLSKNENTFFPFVGYVQCMPSFFQKVLLAVLNGTELMEAVIMIYLLRRSKPMRQDSVKKRLCFDACDSAKIVADAVISDFNEVLEAVMRPNQDPGVKRLRRMAIIFYIYVNVLGVPERVTFSDDAILVSSPLHQIPLAMLQSLFWITQVVCFLFCCFSMASKI
ncbi:hypothetical protein POUND7_007355 [Theobroma cacao]